MCGNLFQLNPSIHPVGRSSRAFKRYDVRLAHKVSSRVRNARRNALPLWELTLHAPAPYIRSLPMSVSKIQIGQLWKKDGTADTYLVTRIYNEALSTMVILRKSGSEEEALTRVKAERTATGQNIPGFSPAQEDEKF
jgi:hypothetical protein